MHLCRRFIALVVIAAALFASPSAKAESIADRVDGKWPTEKKVVVGALFAASLASTGYMIFTIVERENAQARINQDFPRNGGDARVADCSTPAQCSDLRSAVDDRKAWADQTPYAAAAALGTALAAGAFAALWSNGNTSLAPSASAHGGSLAIVGRF